MSGLRGDELHREVRMYYEIRERLLGRCGPPFGYVSAEISSGLAEFVEVRALCPPTPWPREQDRAIVRHAERVVRCPGMLTNARYGCVPPSAVRSYTHICG
jgi:hypothetical protein